MERRKKTLLQKCPTRAIYSLLLQFMHAFIDSSFNLCVHAASGERNGNPLQYSCLENPVDGGAWWAAVHRVAQSQTWPKWLSMHACIGEGNSNPLQYFCLKNPRNRGAWWAAVYGVAQSWTRLSDWTELKVVIYTEYFFQWCYMYDLFIICCS